MDTSKGMNLFRSLFAAIDSAVYGLISVVYEILLNITKVEIFNSDAIEQMATQIYTLLGIFMLFKVTFSFISYLVNPDSLTDKSKGVQKVILNVMLVLAMIIITPTAFRKMYDLQNAILTDDVIPKFILGSNGQSFGARSYKMSDVCPEVSYANKDGHYIAILVFRPFYQLEQGIGSSDATDYCKIANAYTSYYGTVSLYLSGDIVNDSVNSKYTVDYKLFISTIVGIVVLLILVSFCFDIAVRTIKLGFLQLIAPIPIISYVDPKSGKDGMFMKWLKEVGKTWADLFIRLAALFFAVYIIGLTANDDMFTAVSEYKFWVILFIIIGALMFAKKLPKLIEDILGIKLGGDLTLNPMKKIRDNALGGKFIGDIPKKTLGFGAGLAGGMIAGGVAGNQVGAMGRGMLLGGLSGAKRGIKDPKGAFTKGMSEEFKNLTGNEMSRLSLGKLMLSGSGKVAVQDTKDNLKIAYSNLNDKQTELNVSEHTTASLAEKLRAKGFDITNIDNAIKDSSARQTSQLKKVDEARDNAIKFNEAYTEAQAEYQEMQKSIDSGMVGANGQPFYSQQQLAAAKARMEQVESQYKNAQSVLQTEEGLLADYKQAEVDLNTYRANKENEALLRDEISAIQKNIETIKGEKAQRERFYQVDKTPQQDYQKAVAEETNRQKKS